MRRYSKLQNGYKHRSSQASHLKSCVSTLNVQHKSLRNLKRGRQFPTLEQKHGDREKTEGYASGLRRWICFISQSKPWLYTKRDRMCPGTLCVWVPLFITSNTSSAYCQYGASSTMHLNSMSATGDLSPGATAGDLLSSCILSHLGAHHYPRCCPVTSCRAIFVIL